MSNHGSSALPEPGFLARWVWPVVHGAAGVGDLVLAAHSIPTGLGAVASTAQATQAVLQANVSDAERAANGVLEDTPEVAGRLAILQAEGEEWQARITSLLRVLMEAGRHPEREMREALGRFGARVLVEDLERVEMFELAEALARMTLVDYEILKAAGEAWTPGKPEETDLKHDLVAMNPHRPSVADDRWIQDRLAKKLPLNLYRVRRTILRLQGMHLLAVPPTGSTDQPQAVSYVGLTQFGRDLLSAASSSPADW